MNQNLIEKVIIKSLDDIILMNIMKIDYIYTIWIRILLFLIFFLIYLFATDPTPIGQLNLEPLP